MSKDKPVSADHLINEAEAIAAGRDPGEQPTPGASSPHPSGEGNPSPEPAPPSPDAVIIGQLLCSFADGLLVLAGAAPLDPMLVPQAVPAWARIVEKYAPALVSVGGPESTLLLLYGSHLTLCYVQKWNQQKPSSSEKPEAEKPRSLSPMPLESGK